MGKYIRKAKMAVGAADLAVMETSLGVRTRAKTLAAKSQPPPSPASNSSAAAAAASSYLQLRSRRLLKPPVSVPTHYSKRKKQSTDQISQNPSPSPNPRASSRLRMASSESVGSYFNNGNNDVSAEAIKRNSCEQSREVGRDEILLENDNKAASKCDLGGVGGGLGEASFGENVLEFESRERSTRESTPSSLIRDPEAVRTPGSTTRPTRSSRRISDSDRRHIPPSHEMDEFFAGVEEEQQRNFITKYNFDPVNDKPLPGRYEWEKLDPPDTK